MSRLRLLAGKRDPWSPWVVPRSLQGDWWRAEDRPVAALVTDDGAGLISSWAGCINRLALTASGTARGQYSATGFAGAYPAISGNGTTVVMNRESTAGLPTGTTPGFIAFIGGPFTASDTIIQYGGGGTSVVRGIETASAPLLRARAVNVVATSAATGLTAMIVLFIMEATRLRLRVNGVETVVTNVLGSTTSIRARFFATTAASPTQFAAGPLAEAMIHPAWPDADYLRLEGYLARKYSLADIALPADHPYARSAP